MALMAMTPGAGLLDTGPVPSDLLLVSVEYKGRKFQSKNVGAISYKQNGPGLCGLQSFHDWEQTNYTRQSFKAFDQP
jgi:hypothetical protein